MDTDPMAAVQAELMRRVAQAVYCSMATVDRQGRPRSRILHPIWEGQFGAGLTGWAISWPGSHKARHLQHNPHVSLAYIHDSEKPVYIDCTAEWVDTVSVKERIWALYKDTPPPLGFDPLPYYGTVHHVYFGLLKFTPWRIELADLNGTGQIWRKPAAG